MKPQLNTTPPPAPDPAPNARILLPLTIVLAILFIAGYQVSQTLPDPMEGITDPIEAQYGNNRMPDWHPMPFESVDGAARSPCPMLNTLANHGYLPRDGRNIDRDTLDKALAQLNLASSVRNTLIDGVKSLTRPKSAAEADVYVLDLSDLQKHGVLEHDVSLSRDDYRPSLGADRHWKISDTLVQQMTALADKRGFLDYDSMARVRNLRQKQSEAEADAMQHTDPSAISADDRRPVDFGLKVQPIAHGECALLLEVMGRNGHIHAANVESLFGRERFPEGWAPPRNAVGVFSLVSGALKCAAKRFQPGNAAPNPPPSSYKPEPTANAERTDL